MPQLRRRVWSLHLRLRRVPPAPTLTPKWRVDALPNWLRWPTTTTVNEDRREEWWVGCGVWGMRASVRITLNHALTMSQGPASVSSSYSCLLPAAWPRPIWQQSFVSSAASCRFPSPSPVPLCAVTSLRYFRSAAANEFLFASDSSGVKSSVFMNFSALCRRQCGWAHVLIRFHSPIIT